MEEQLETILHNVCALLKLKRMDDAAKITSENKASIVKVYGREFEYDVDPEIYISNKWEIQIEVPLIDFVRIEKQITEQIKIISDHKTSDSFSCILVPLLIEKENWRDASKKLTKLHFKNLRDIADYLESDSMHEQIKLIEYNIDNHPKSAILPARTLIECFSKAIQEKRNPTPETTKENRKNPVAVT